MIASQRPLSASIGIYKTRFMRESHLASEEMVISWGLQSRIWVSKDQVINRVINDILDQSSGMLKKKKTPKTPGNPSHAS